MSEERPEEKREWSMKAGASRLILGLVLIAAGEAMIVVHRAAVSDYYFPVIWLGYILTLDGLLTRLGKVSLWRTERRVFLLMIPASAAFWWLFEAFDQAVGSWRYVGAGGFTQAGYIAYASVCFSTVLLAVWETAICVDALLPGRPETGSGLAAGLRDRRGWETSPPPAMAVTKFHALQSPASVHPSWAALHHVPLRLSGAFRTFGDIITTSFLDTPRAGTRAAPTSTGRKICQALGAEPLSVRRPQRLMLPASFLFGIACLVLPIVFPRYAFSLIWVSLFFLLDPINAWLGRTSLLAEALRGHFRTALAFAVAGPICGFFWEFWNYWAIVKWVYNVPFVSQLHLFEMPLPGYLGYIPFGLEAYAATVFVIPALTSLMAGFSSSTNAPHGQTVSAVSKMEA